MINLRHIVLKLNDGEKRFFVMQKIFVLKYGIVYRLFRMAIQAYTLS